MFWLIQADVLRQLREARKGAELSAGEQRAHEERMAARRGPRNLTVAGDVAEIRVEGVLTKHPDFWAWLLGLGNTTYADIIEAIALAKSDPGVKSVRLFVDSPGGTADGLFDTFAALEDLRASKPISVLAANAYSAAYGIAAVAGKITATNAASMFGSVGVAVSYMVWEDVIDLTNTESPDKRPDISTEEGRAVIVRELDAIFDLFASAIAAGRTNAGKEMTRDDVAETFGRGASFVAGDAKKRKMIDALAKPSLRVVPEPDVAAPAAQKEASTDGRGKVSKMTLEELRAQHPELYTAAVQTGVTQERDRVCAHLTMGEASGDTATASKAIRSGDAMTQALQAQYLAAGMNRADRKTRQAESDAAGKVTDPAETPPEQQPGAGGDIGDAIVAALKAQGGI